MSLMRLALCVLHKHPLITGTMAQEGQYESADFYVYDISLPFNCKSFWLAFGSLVSKPTPPPIHFSPLPPILVSFAISCSDNCHQDSHSRLHLHFIVVMVTLMTALSLWPGNTNTFRGIRGSRTMLNATFWPFAQINKCTL